MKNRLLFPIIFAFIFSACSDFTGNEDAVEASLKPGPDTTAPILNEVTAVTTPTTDTTPNYTFSSSEAGTITYGGSCSSSEKNAKSGNNTITLSTLSNGTYSDCTITVKDTSGNSSATLIISTFVVDSPTPTTPRTYYDLHGVAYGNNTFVAVGQSGTVRISSDNGATWDNSTSGTTKWLAEIAYGNSTFVAVGQSGTHLYSSDDGATWSVGTWSPTVDITGVAFGNNTFLGVSSTYLTKSTDNGANWDLECSGLRIYDIAFGGNSKFVGSGASGAIGITDNGSSCGLGSSDTTTHYLYGTTSGNNKFLSVGSSGKLILFDNNGSNVSNLTSPVTKTLYAAAYGNNIFVAVGSKTVVVTNNVGGSATETENTYSFNDVTFGNGVFVAVGNDEIIYRSTDGDTWTKVYPL